MEVSLHYAIGLVISKTRNIKKVEGQALNRIRFGPTCPESKNPVPVELEDRAQSRKNRTRNNPLFLDA